MENQCLGLAEALHLSPVIKRIALRTPWKQFVPFLRHGLRFAFSPQGDLLTPPWPDLVIATGRISIPAALYVRQASHKNGIKRALTVQIQNPVIDPLRFDCVVVPQHDGLSGPNVITTRGALHRVTQEKLRSEADKLLPTLSHLKSPRIAVLIGGSSAVYRLTPHEMVPLAAQLAALAKTTGGSLLVTPSRRTGENNIAILRQALIGVPSIIWDGKGENPYYGMLGLADYILVTCDSVNMVSEACTTGKPVYVIDLPGGSDKFRKFHQILRDSHMTRPFAGTLAPWDYKPLNDVEFVAEKIRELIEARAQ